MSIAINNLTRDEKDLLLKKLIKCDYSKMSEEEKRFFKDEMRDKTMRNHRKVKKAIKRENKMCKLLNIY